MRSFSEIRESPNYQRLKNSVEFKAEWRSTWIVGVFCLILILLMFTVGSLNSADTARAVIGTIIMIPCLLYQVYRLVRIFFHMDSFTYTEAVLDRPKQGYKGSMYFTVRVRNRFGKEIDVDTNNIFNRNEPCFEDYVNQKVLIGYNNVTGLVVVIKKLP
jgi:hypothetical protein